MSVSTESDYWKDEKAASIPSMNFCQSTPFTLQVSFISSSDSPSLKARYLWSKKLSCASTLQFFGKRLLGVERLLSVISLMLFARKVQKVYSPPLFARLRLKRRMRSLKSSPRLFVFSHSGCISPLSQ